MNDRACLQAISGNLLRIAEWYYKDSVGNLALCQRYLDQAKQLARQVRLKRAQVQLKQLDQLILGGPETIARQAERCLTLGVLLQQPERWLQR